LQGTSTVSADDIYMEVLTGRDLSIQVIDKFRLDTLYKKNSKDLLLKRYKEDLIVNEEQTGIISLSFESKNRQLAKELISFAVSRANEMYLRLQKERYRQSLDYLDHLQESLLDSLEKANQAYSKFYIENSIVDLTAQIQLTLSALAGYEEQIKNLRRSELNYGENTSAALELSEKRKLLEAEYRKLRAGIEASNKPNLNSVYVNTNWAVSKLVEKEKLEANLLRLAKIGESVATEIIMTEAKAMKNLPVIQVVQEAYLPDWKTIPKRIVWGITSFASALVLINFVLLIQGIMSQKLQGTEAVREAIIRIVKSLKG